MDLICRGRPTSVCNLGSAGVGERGGYRELTLRADQEFGGGLVRRPSILPAPWRYPGHPPAMKETRSGGVRICARVLAGLRPRSSCGSHRKIPTLRLRLYGGCGSGGDCRGEVRGGSGQS